MIDVIAACLYVILFPPHHVMSLLLLTGPLWWLPLSQLHVVDVEGEREMGGGGGGGGRRRGHVGMVYKRRQEERKDVKSDGEKEKRKA